MRNYLPMKKDSLGRTGRNGIAHRAGNGKNLGVRAFPQGEGRGGLGREPRGEPPSVRRGGNLRPKHPPDRFRARPGPLVSGPGRVLFAAAYDRPRVRAMKESNDSSPTCHHASWSAR
ncbi:hypothetical protein BLTE_11070 [Blastochloris tepida]|uniref:Uncharacterized protein n=1 Tax=Blastochloris tepida TaxID=2233851 RepID=A0A348FYN9_9HYPH|nr:hypothetical protein BLTE_11070 [Blastochloris tepida]